MRRVAVLGDSLTRRGLEEPGGWCGLLAAAYAGRADVVARGFSGYSSRWLLATLASLLEEDLGAARKEGELAVVWIGANDAVLNVTGKRQFVPIDEYCENLGAIVKRLRDRGADVVVMTPPPIDEAMRLEHQREKYGDKATGQLERSLFNTKLYARACRATFADDPSVVVVDIFAAILAEANPRALLCDGLHLSAEGQRFVFETFMRAIAAYLPQWAPKALEGPHLALDEIPTFPARLPAMAPSRSLLERDAGAPASQVEDHAGSANDPSDPQDAKAVGGPRGAEGGPPQPKSAMARFLPSMFPFMRSSSPETETILRNARFWSWELGAFTAPGHELVLRGGKIAALRPDSSAAGVDETAEGVEFHDLGGGYVLPGLADAHIHVYQLGEGKRNLDLLGCKSIDELKKRLAAFVAKNPDREWIVGTGWDHELMGGVLPTREDLDAVVPAGIKVVLWRVCLHILVASTEALEASHIALSNPAPVTGGEIDTDPATGATTGILRERATEAVVAHIKETNPAILAESVSQGLAECLRYGLTGVQTNDEATLEIYRKLDRDGKLPIRVQLTPKHGEVDGPWSSSSGMLAIDRVKIFTDGALGSSTAALRNLDDPDDEGSYSGILVHGQAELLEMVTQARDKKLRVEAHAIGDKAAECTLRAFRDAGLTARDRPVLTHCQILGADLVSQMAAGGVIANVQPTFVPTDAAWIYERVHNEGQLSHAYAWKTLLNVGIQVSGSSDAPVECCSPLLGMYDAIFRPSSHDRAHAKAFHGKEALSFAQALHLYTLGAQFAARREGTRGRIEPGFAADLTVVSEDISQDPKRLLSAQVTHVYVAGQSRLEGGPGPSVGATLHRSSPYMEGKNGNFRDQLRCGCHHNHAHVPY